GHVIGDGERSRTNRRQHMASGRSGQTSDAMPAGWTAPTYAISLCAHRLRQWPRPGSQRDLKMVVPTHLPGGVPVEREVRAAAEGGRISGARGGDRERYERVGMRSVKYVSRGFQQGGQRLTDETGQVIGTEAQRRDRAAEHRT